MAQIGIFLLVNVFTALLPPVDENVSYYDILGVTNSATNEDIRKAYKKLSLRLHPDKLAQSGANEEETKEAAEKYEQVQEAYGVLVNDEKREKYDRLKTVTRYRFYERGALASPGAIYENLTGASFMDKTKLVGCATALIIIVLLQPILIAAAVNQSLEQSGALRNASWVVIFIPTWIFFGVFILFNIALITLIAPSQRLPMIIWSIELILWFIGLLFLCLRWDNTWTSPYSQILVPFYVAFIFRLVGKVLVLRKIRQDVQRMVTSSFLEVNVLKGRTLDDLTEAEQEELKRDFLVVSVPDDFEPIPTEDGVELDEAKIEEQKVEASAEFEAATDIYNTTFMACVCLVVFGTTFLILLSRKLDGKMSGSWWLVFMPIWLWLSSRLLVNFYRCLCGTAASDEILLHMKDMTEQAEDDREDSEQVKSNHTNEKRVVGLSDDGVDLEKTTNAGTSSDTEVDVEVETPAEVLVDEKTFAKPDNIIEDKDNAEAKDATIDIEEGKKDTDEDEEDAEYIHVDEETFKAWQSAYEQAEETAMQEQAKACTECCNVTVQLTLLCLIVAKIEKNYDNVDPNDTGFNVFWILFPFFLFFGLVCCCCAILIYGAAPGSATDLQDGDDVVEIDPQSAPTPDDDEEGAIPLPDEGESKGAQKIDVEETDTKEKQDGGFRDEPPEPKDDLKSTDMDDLD